MREDTKRALPKTFKERLWGFLVFVGVLACFTSAVAAMNWWGHRRVRHFLAWRVIETAHGREASPGRVAALEALAWERVSLRSIDLAGVNLRGARLDRAILIEANLIGADLREAELNRAILTEAELIGADLREAELGKANLHEADLSGACLRGSNLIEAELRGAKLIGAELKGALLCGSILSSADLQKADLSKAGLMDAVLGGADLSGVRLDDSNLTGADLQGADLRGAKIRGALLDGANMRGVRNWREISDLTDALCSQVKNPPLGFLRFAKEHGAYVSGERLKKEQAAIDAFSSKATKQPASSQQIP